MPNPFSLHHGSLSSFEGLLLHTREAIEQLARSHRKEIHDLCEQKERLSLFLEQSPAEACFERAEELVEYDTLRALATDVPCERAHLQHEFEFPEGVVPCERLELAPYSSYSEVPEGQAIVSKPFRNHSSLRQTGNAISILSGNPNRDSKSISIPLAQQAEKLANSKAKDRTSAVTFNSNVSSPSSASKAVAFGDQQAEKQGESKSKGFARGSAVTFDPTLSMSRSVSFQVGRGESHGDNDVMCESQFAFDASFSKSVHMAVGLNRSENTSDYSKRRFSDPTASHNASMAVGRMESTGAPKKWKVSFAPRSPWSQFPEYRHIKLSDFQWRIKVDTTAMVRRRVQTVHQNKKSPILQSLIVHPQGRVRILWTVLCMLLLIYDFVTVPVTLCFVLEPSNYSKGMEMFTALFWTVDLVFTFFTGVADASDLEMRPQKIAFMYLRSWFLFDALLILQDWLTIALANDKISCFSLLRGARWFGWMRSLRMARFLRMAKFKPLVRQLVFHFNLTNDNMALTKSFVVLTGMLMMALHMTACFWHLLGEGLPDGWIQANDLESASVARRYLVSLRWTCTRLHGIASGNRIENPWECFVDAFLVLASVLATAIYMGQVTVMSITWVGSHTYFVRKLAAAYVRRHRISTQLASRLTSVLKAATFAGAGEIVTDEARLLADLPRSLQEDLRFEARAPILCIKRIFNDMYSVNQRVVRHVCNQAVFVDVAVQSEVLFAFGDACVRMLFTLPQCCSYMHRKTMHKAIEDIEVESDEEGGSFKKHIAFSEPVLWTTWEHRGTLYAKEESVLLTLNADEFGSVILQYHEARVHAVKYAIHFVWQLNRVHQGKLTDEVDFNTLTIDEIDQEIYHGSEEDHFMFISHYKIEAGTEAALMRDQLEPILKAQTNHPANNLRSPIFIDSEDLDDLAKLKLHVKKSGNLVLMLTPGVLSRPWCLVEIVMASRSKVRIVPVEVQRPGCRYQYPDEDFYANLLSGKFLDSGATNILENEGLTLQDVSSAIREVFQKIALPFSPHKSKKIRDAELEDILKRCSNGKAMGEGNASYGILTKENCRTFK